MEPRISALVVTWNSAARLPGLLETLALHDEPIEVIQVDNSSADSSVEAGSQWSGSLTQIRNDANHGYAAALRQAFEAANTEFVLVANADVRFEPGALRVLEDRLQLDAGIGAVGPKLLESDGSIQLTCARRLPSLGSAAVHALGLRPLVRGTRLDPYTYPVPTYDVERDVPAISGAVMLVRRQALELAGGVDDRWFMYFEDLDICARLKQAGWRIRYCPGSSAIHDGAASSPRTPALETWLAVHLEAAVNLYLRVHRGPSSGLAHRGLVALAGALWLARAPLTRARGAGFGRGIGLLRWAITRTMPSSGRPK